jgi:hypothetical protein
MRKIDKIDKIVWKCEAHRSSSVTGNLCLLTSHHFVGGKGPTKEYPEPIAAVGDTVDMEHYINPILTESNLIETNDVSVQTVLIMDAINAYTCNCMSE